MKILKKVFKYGDLHFIVRKITHVNGKTMKREGIGRTHLEVQGCQDWEGTGLGSTAL